MGTPGCVPVESSLGRPCPTVWKYSVTSGEVNKRHKRLFCSFVNWSFGYSLTTVNCLFLYLNRLFKQIFRENVNGKIAGRYWRLLKTSRHSWNRNTTMPYGCGSWTTSSKNESTISSEMWRSLTQSKNWFISTLLQATKRKTPPRAPRGSCEGRIGLKRTEASCPNISFFFVSEKFDLRLGAFYVDFIESKSASH